MRTGRDEKGSLSRIEGYGALPHPRLTGYLRDCRRDRGPVGLARREDVFAPVDLEADRTEGFLTDPRLDLPKQQGEVARVGPKHRGDKVDVAPIAERDAPGLAEEPREADCSREVGNFELHAFGIAFRVHRVSSRSTTPRSSRTRSRAEISTPSAGDESSRMRAFSIDFSACATRKRRMSAGLVRERREPPPTDPSTRTGVPVSSIWPRPCMAPPSRIRRTARLTRSGQLRWPRRRGPTGQGRRRLRGHEP